MWSRADLLAKRGRSRLASLVACALVAGLVPVLSANPAQAQTYLLGIDVSHHQEKTAEIDWNQVADSGQRYVFHKATEGATFADPKYAENRASVDAIGIPFGAYHFAYAQGGSLDAARADAISEASYFLQVAQPAPGDLLPVLDLETNPQGMPPARLIAWTQAWLDRVELELGVKPLIYTNPNFWANHMNDTTTFAEQGFPLWIANYTDNSTPRVPANNWAGRGWAFWQYTSQGTVPGISGPVDRNRYAGSDLAPYTIAGAPEPEPTPEPTPPPDDVAAPASPRVTHPRRARTLATVIKVAWVAPEAGNLSYDVRYRHALRNGVFTDYADLASGTSQTFSSIGADPGTTYCFSVRATDEAGNTSGWSADRCTVSPLDDRALRSSGPWAERSNDSFYRKTFTKTKRRGASLVIGRTRMRSIHVVAQRCPGCGKVKVLLNGNRVGTVSLAANRRRNKSMLEAASFSRVRGGQVKLVVVSRGAPVKIDGLALTLKR